jgi:hypothetical protein
MLRVMKIALVVACIGSGLGLFGCAHQSSSGGDAAATASAPAATIQLEAGEYARAFDAARNELRELGFILDRVDAQAGVITTLPKGTGGLATPWDQEQSGLDDRAEDAVERHRRIVRVDFMPAGAAPGSAEGRDLRTEAGPIEGQVSATVYRVHQPGWRVNPQAILDSSYTRDPQLDERGMSAYGVAVRQDDALARRIAVRVRTRTSQQHAGG